MNPSSCYLQISPVRYPYLHLQSNHSVSKNERHVCMRSFKLISEMTVMDNTFAYPKYATAGRSKFYHILQPEKTRLPLAKTYCGRSIIFPHVNTISGNWIMTYRDGKPLPTPHYNVPAAYKVCKVCKSRTQIR